MYITLEIKTLTRHKRKEDIVLENNETKDLRESLWEWEADNNEAEMLDRLVGDHYDEPNGLDTLNHNKFHEAQRVIRIFNLSNSSSVVDFGSGAGYIAYHVAPTVEKLYCVDVSKSFLATASAFNKKHSNVEYINIPFAGFSNIPQVDKIYCLALFIHFTMYDIFNHLTGFYNCLSPGGEVFFDTLSDEYIDFNSKKWLSTTVKTISKPYSNFTNVKYNNSLVIIKMLKNIGFVVVDTFDDANHSFFHIMKPYED